MSVLDKPFKHTSMLMSADEQLSDQLQQERWQALSKQCDMYKAASTITIDGNELKVRDLLWGVVANVKGPSKYRNKYGTERWVLVRNAIGCGSTVARGLCREFGFDPDEALRS